MRFCEIDDSEGQKSEAKAKFNHRAAVLASSFSADPAHAFSGGLDTLSMSTSVFYSSTSSNVYLDSTMLELTLTTEKVNSLGIHDDSILP